MLAQDQANLGTSLMRALRSARQSWWRRALVDAGLAAILAAAGAVVVAWARAWLFGLADGQLAGASLLTLVAAAAGGLLLWLVVAAFRSPSLLELARRVDRLLGQSETFSTSYEVLLRGGQANVVTRALLSDVEKRAERLTVGPAGWRRGSAWLGWSALPVAVVAAVLLVVPVPGRQATAGARQALLNPGNSQDRAQEAATLAGAAELLDLVAEQENSDYLRALGASFANLAERVGSGSVTAAESNRLAQELTQHLQAASQEIGGRFAGAVSEAFAGVAGEPESGANPQAAGSAASPSVAAGAEAATDPALAAASIANSEASSSFYESLNALMDQFEADPTAVGVRPERTSARDSSGGDGFYGGVLNAETDPNAAAPQQAALGRSEGQAGGAPVGAAEHSSDAAGDAAGQGGADLGAGSDSFLGLTTSGGALSALRLNESDDGKFVEMELVPRADDTAASSAVSTGAVPAFSRADESAFTTRGIGAEHADVVSRYFTPDTFTPSTVPAGDRP